MIAHVEGVHAVRLNSMLDTVVISGEYICCSVVFGTLVGVFVLSGMWYQLLMTWAISCPLWSSVNECRSVGCAFTSPVWYICDVMYVRVNCFVVRGCAVSRRCINMLGVVNMYLDHFQFCVVCINGRMCVCCNDCYVFLTSIISPPHVLCD